MFMHSSPISVAPMMRYTHRFFRVLIRRLSKHTLTYTEMVTAAAINHGKAEKFLRFENEEQPVVLQLGGDNPQEMARAAKTGVEFGYREININAGCPSDRVQSGNFGACLMADPHLVAQMVDAMHRASGLPVSVKTRIGIDDQDEYAFLHKFVEVVSKAGCRRFIIHARKAILAGLSPAQNRKIPPLKYETVFNLKNDFPDLVIELNGGIVDLQTAHSFLNRVDGVMLGRAITDDPFILHRADELFFNEAPFAGTMAGVVEGLLDDVERWQSEGEPPSLILHPFLSLFKGVAGGKHFRRAVSQPIKPAESLANRISAALKFIQPKMIADATIKTFSTIPR